MKSLESFLTEKPQPTTVTDTTVTTPPPTFGEPEQTGIGVTESTPDTTFGDDTIPEYLYVDAQAVGYNDLQTQTDIYNFSVMNTLPIFGETSILDIGGGRSDLYTHIKTNFPGLTLKYTNFETNPVFAQISKEKFEAVGESVKVFNEDFLTSTNVEKHDHVFLIGSLNINYGWETDNWSRFELTLRRALDVANESVTFVLLQDNGGEDQYIAYPIPNVVELLLMFNFPFVIQYGDIPGVYKFTIKKKPIYITQ